MLRLLYLCIQPPDRSPSQRYRFEQFEPYLRDRGVEIEYAPALTAEDLPVFYGTNSAAAKARVAVQALARRLWSVRPRTVSGRFDVVLVQREAFFLFNAWSEWLAHLQAPVVLDFDDAIWIHAVSEANRRFRWLKNVEKVRDCAALASVVIAGNEYLASWAREYNDSVRVIPTCVDTDRYTAPARAFSPTVTVGWCGSPSTIAHLRPILPALRRVKERYGDRVCIRVMGDPHFHDEALQLQGEAWSSNDELRFLHEMDIGLMPLPDDEWSKGKCGLKGLTSMACGAATIMSPVGVNRNIVKHGTNGLHAESVDDWFQSICRLVDNRALRERLGRAGRETVLAGYSVARWRQPFYDAILAAAESNVKSRGRKV